MPKLLVLQHVAHEILGTLDPLLRSYGFRNHYVNFDRDPGAQPSLDGYHGLVVLGGPMNVDETDRYPHLDTEVKLLREALSRDFRFWVSAWAPNCSRAHSARKSVPDPKRKSAGTISMSHKPPRTTLCWVILTLLRLSSSGTVTPLTFRRAHNSSPLLPDVPTKPSVLGDAPTACNSIWKWTPP